MRGCTLEAQMRGVSRALGIEVEHRDGPMGKCFVAQDPTLDKAWPDIAGIEAVRKFEVHYRLASGAEKALKELHSAVYRARGEEVYRRQDRKCCFCGKVMRAYEIDHRIPRARGRDDRIENLQCCCAGLSGCDGHRRKHGG